MLSSLSKQTNVCNAVTRTSVGLVQAHPKIRTEVEFALGTVGLNKMCRSCYLRVPIINGYKFWKIAVLLLAILKF